MILSNRDFAIHKCFQKILHNLQVRKFGFLSAVRATCHTVWTHICLKHHPSDDENFLSGPSPISRSFKLLQLASVRTFQQYVRTTLSVQQASGFLSKAQLWEDSCNRPDDVDSRPDALIHKASIAIQIQTSGWRSSWSRHACIRYENCVHQINRSYDHPPSPDTRSLYMEITCSGSATVRTTGHHRLDAVEKQERISATAHGRPMTTVRTAPSFYQAKRSFESSAYK
jgi:hypothetical protein